MAARAWPTAWQDELDSTNAKCRKIRGKFAWLFVVQNTKMWRYPGPCYHTRIPGLECPEPACASRKRVSIPVFYMERISAHTLYVSHWQLGPFFAIATPWIYDDVWGQKTLNEEVLASMRCPWRDSLLNRLRRRNYEKKWCGNGRFFSRFCCRVGECGWRAMVM